MDSISENLENRSNVVKVAALSGLGISWQNVVQANSEFSNWEKEFNDIFYEKWDDYSVNRIQELNEYKDLLQNFVTDPTEGIGDIEDISQTIQKLRSQDVNARWEFERLFLETGGQGAENALGYYDYEDGNSIFVKYTESQLNDLKEGNVIRIDGKAIEGHHINDVSTNALDLDKIEEVFNANNIIPITREAHLYSSEYGHGGSWQNSTEGSATSVFDTRDNIMDENRALTDADILFSDLGFASLIGAGAGLISVSLQIYNGKNDPRPWKKKAAVIASTGLIDGISVGGFSLMANHIRSGIMTSLNDSTISSLVSDVSLDHFDVILGSGLSLVGIRMVRDGLIAAAEWNNSGFNSAINQFTRKSISTIRQESAFMGAGFLMDFIVPDPTGIYFGIRIASGVYKLAKNIQVQNRLKSIQLNTHYKFAQSNINSNFRSEYPS